MPGPGEPQPHSRDLAVNVCIRGVLLARVLVCAEGRRDDARDLLQRPPGLPPAHHTHAEATMPFQRVREELERGFRLGAALDGTYWQSLRYEDAGGQLGADVPIVKVR